MPSSDAPPLEQPPFQLHKLTHHTQLLRYPSYQQAVTLGPNWPAALNNLAWILATASDPQLRDGAEAVKLATRACTLTEFKEAVLVGTLAAAYAESGRFQDAVMTAEKAKDLAASAGKKELATG